MARRRHTPEQVIKKLREAEVAIAEGSTVAEAARQIGATEQTFYRWRSGGCRRLRPGYGDVRHIPHHHLCLLFHAFQSLGVDKTEGDYIF